MEHYMDASLLQGIFQLFQTRKVAVLYPALYAALPLAPMKSTPHSLHGLLSPRLHSGLVNPGLTCLSSLSIPNATGVK